jgi:hypothetical protein
VVNPSLAGSCHWKSRWAFVTSLYGRYVRESMTVGPLRGAFEATNASTRYRLLLAAKPDNTLSLRRSKKIFLHQVTQ